MKKNTSVFLYSLILLLILSCSSSRPVSSLQSSQRTISLGGERYSESEYGKFISWRAYDYDFSGPVQVEVGYFENPLFAEFGFILFDGGDAGEVTSYRRTGLEHRWDWGPKGSEYAFVIKTDGTGLYYDFTSVEAGESTKARAVYKCRKR